jgi:hypothetical protein
MVTMTDEEKRRAIRESRELLARLQGERNPEPEPTPAPEVPMPVIETASERWQREADATDAERKAAKLAMRNSEQRELERHRDTARDIIRRSEFEDRLASERRFSSDVLIEALADIYQRLHQVEQSARPATSEHGKVLDLPSSSSFLRRCTN